MRQFEPTRYELDFNKQLVEWISKLEKVSKGTMTDDRHGLVRWFPDAVNLYLVEPKKSIIYDELNALTNTFKSWHRDLGWEKARDKALIRLGLVNGILAAPPHKETIIVEKEKIKTEYKVRDVIVTKKVIPWKWIGAGGATLLALGYVVPKLAKKRA